MRSFFATRARKREMLRHERQRLARKLAEYLAALGGQLEPAPACSPGPAAVYLATLAGRVRVTCYGNWLACRFEEPDLARALLPHAPGERLNSSSGKWNFHFPRVTAGEALAALRAELEPILPGRERTHP